MHRTPPLYLLTSLLIACPPLAAAQDPACPLHAQHMAQAAAASGTGAAGAPSGTSATGATPGILERGDRTMGFDHARTTHHFLLADDGGTIQVEADDAADTPSRDAIRHHLAGIAKAFAAGDFSSPLAIHGRVLPGIPEMIALQAEIQVRFEESERGARVRITSSKPEARAAIHAFLRAQIEDHATGDPH
jgi:predicted component of type VI protein secretion system